MASVEIKYKDLKRPSKSESLDIESTLKCMYLNATSLENIFDEFTVVVETNHPNLIVVTETWLKNNSVTNLNGYNLYRKDRCDGRRGGEYVFMLIIRLILMKLGLTNWILAKLNKSGLSCIFVKINI